MSKKHHVLGPSSAPRWLRCIGSVVPKPPYIPSGSAAQEGTACHDLLEAALMGMEYAGMLGMRLGEADHLVEINQEMVDAVDLFMDEVRKLATEVGFKIEDVQSEQYFAAHPLFGGTCDFYVYHEQKLVIIDFKYGRKPVSAKSEQLTCYAALIMGAIQQPVAEIIQVVVQPRSTGEMVTRYSPSPEEVNALIAKVGQAIEIVEKYQGVTETPPELLTVGPHCEYCPKQNGCPAHLQMMSDVVQLAQAPVPTDETEIPNLLYWYEMADVIKGFLRKVDSTLLSHAEAGRMVPGKKLVARYSNREWAIDEKLTESKLMSWFTRTFTGVKAAELKKVEVKSPAQVEAVLKSHKLLDKEAKIKLAQKVRRDVTGVKLVNADEKGDAVDPQHISQFMKAIEEDSQ